jgi:hypothetical protein
MSREPSPALSFPTPTNTSRCARGGARPPEPEIECHDQFSWTALSLFRFISAAYVTGAFECWEAACRVADEAPEVRDSALFVARTSALVRIFRYSRACDLTYMPPSCNRLSKDEVKLMGLLKAARSGVSDELKAIASSLVNAGQEVSTIRAVKALAALSNTDSITHRVNRSTGAQKQARREPSLKRAV